MFAKLISKAPPGSLWFAAGAVFCIVGALLASGPQAREVAQVGWCGAIGFVVLILAFSDRKRLGRG
ncbi:hypothetical protein [Roseomonas mucosa]|uniref:hypothetical protein n=1 Tax=Roseomonas mucosa TaxID=207340 RepID=UPI0028CDF464|nr:hypothetical protein [Roseomonas mucosa]MDT8350960.1 hypothetical protein [Roseomonas mucosa]